MYRIIVLFLTMSILASCARSQGVGYPNFPAYRPLPGQGQYIRPEYLNPLPTPSIPPEDACRSRLYLSLVGRHEGSIFIPGLPGRKRVLKPAFLENFDYEPDDTLYIDPPLIEVREFCLIKFYMLRQFQLSQTVLHWDLFKKTDLQLSST